MRSSVAAISIAVLLAAAGAHAFASDGIQMLPPVTFNSTNKTPCSAATGGLLYWDGVTPIKCVPGSAGDANGNVTVGGDVVILGLATVGGSCPTVGALAQDGAGKMLSCQTVALNTGGTATLWQSIVTPGTLAGYCLGNGTDVTVAVSPAYPTVTPDWPAMTMTGSTYEHAQCACSAGWSLIETGVTGSTEIEGNVGVSGNYPQSYTQTTVAYTCLKN